MTKNDNLAIFELLYDTLNNSDVKGTSRKHIDLCIGSFILLKVSILSGNSTTQCKKQWNRY